MFSRRFLAAYRHRTLCHDASRNETWFISATPNNTMGYENPISDYAISADLSGLSHLSTPEKLRLIETLWDEMAAEPSSIPLEDLQKAELDRRETEPGSTLNE